MKKKQTFKVSTPTLYSKKSLEKKMESNEVGKQILAIREAYKAMLLSTPEREPLIALGSLRRGALVSASTVPHHGKAAADQPIVWVVGLAWKPDPLAIRTASVPVRWDQVGFAFLRRLQ